MAAQVWTLSGECVAELVGHTALVYCAACTFDGLVASGSEDNTAKLWHADGTCLQVRWRVAPSGALRAAWRARGGCLMLPHATSKRST